MKGKIITGVLLMVVAIVLLTRLGPKVNSGDVEVVKVENPQSSDSTQIENGLTAALNEGLGKVKYKDDLVLDKVNHVEFSNYISESMSVLVVVWTEDITEQDNKQSLNKRLATEMTCVLKTSFEYTHIDDVIVKLVVPTIDDQGNFLYEDYDKASQTKKPKATEAATIDVHRTDLRQTSIDKITPDNLSGLTNFTIKAPLDYRKGYSQAK